MAKRRFAGRATIRRNCFTGCSKKLISKAAASEEARRTLRYVEPLSAARTMLADFFSFLLGWEEHAPTEESVGTAEI